MNNINIIEEGDIFRRRKPWWKFWFTPWKLRVKKDLDGELWLIDPYGAWFARIDDYTKEEFEIEYKKEVCE